MPRGEGTLERPDKSFRRRNAEMPRPWSNDRQSETWKALSSPSLPSCPHCREQQSKGVVGIKHLCLGPRKLSAWNWTSCCQGCVSAHWELLLSIEHPKRKGLDYVRTTAPPSARRARTRLFHPGSWETLWAPGHHLPTLGVRGRGSVNTGSRKLRPAALLLTEETHKANKDLHDHVISPRYSSASFPKDLCFLSGGETWLTGD